MPAAPITYVVRYGVFFASAADGIAARTINGGSILLGGMTPATAAATFPLGTIIQSGAFVLFGLTGVPGPIPGAYADMTQGVGGAVTWTPTSRILATDTLTSLTEFFGDGTTAPVNVEWDGTLIFDAGSGGGVLPPAVGPALPIQGKFQIQVIPYTGNGVNGRLIPTTFDLSVGTVAVWVFPQLTEEAVFRHNDPLMTVSKLTGGTSESSTGGIMSFQAGGFTVANDGGHFIHTNENTLQYTAIVFQDTGTSYMSVGKYNGRSDIITTGVFALNSFDVFCASFVANDIGRNIVVEGVTYTISAIPDATHFRMATRSQSIGNKVITALAGGSSVVTGSLAFPNLVWDFGRAVSFCDDKMPAGTSLGLVSEAVPLTDQIVALNAAAGTNGASFSIGTSNNVNNNALSYYPVAFHIPAGDPVERFFKTWKITGTAGVDQVTGLVFLPIFAGGRPASAALVTTGWRGPWHLAAVGQAFNGSGPVGITAFGLGTITLDNDMAPAGLDIHGWAIRDGRVVVEGVAPDPPAGTNPPACTPPTLPAVGCILPADAGLTESGSACVAPNCLD